MKYTVAQELSSSVEAMRNCRNSGNIEWYRNHAETITNLCYEFMPSGSGFDCGTELDFDASHNDKLVFVTSFHHMNKYGSYDGWTEHTVTVRPAFTGYRLTITGKDRNDIKELIVQSFQESLSRVLTDEERNLAHGVQK